MKKNVLVISSIISTILVAGLIWMIYFNSEVATVPLWAYKLPFFNAIMNSLSMVCLILGIVSIKNKKPDTHKLWMLIAFILSSCFLVSYVLYHHYIGHVTFGGSGLIKAIYLSILAPHILLTFFALPLILTSFYFGLISEFIYHKKIAKLTFPIWLFVSISGLLIFFLQKISSN